MIPEISLKILVHYPRGRAGAELGAGAGASPGSQSCARAAPLSGAVGNGAGRATAAPERAAKAD